MLFRLERRPQSSRVMMLAAPLIAVLMSVIVSSVLLLLLKKPVGLTLHSFFIAPFESFYSITEVLLKFGPLLLIAQALAVGFRAKVWNLSLIHI